MWVARGACSRALVELVSRRMRSPAGGLVRAMAWFSLVQVHHPRLLILRSPAAGFVSAGRFSSGSALA